MKVAAALQGVASLFLDTAPVVYYVERNPAYAALTDDVFDRIDAGTLHGVTSPVTLAECLVVPIQKGRPRPNRTFRTSSSPAPT